MISRHAAMDRKAQVAFETDERSPWQHRQVPSDPGFRADRAQAEKASGGPICPEAALKGQALLWSSAISKGTITGAKQDKHQYAQAQRIKNVSC